MNRHPLCRLFLLPLLLLVSAPAAGLAQRIAWDPNPAEEDVVLYRVSYGSLSRHLPECTGYPFHADVQAPATEWDVPGELPRPLFVSVQAVNRLGLVSDYSLELAVPAATPPPEPSVPPLQPVLPEPVAAGPQPVPEPAQPAPEAATPAVPEDSTGLSEIDSQEPPAVAGAGAQDQPPPPEAGSTEPRPAALAETGAAASDLVLVPLGSHTDSRSPFLVRVGDLNGDGLAELLVADAETQELFSYAGLGGGRFELTQRQDAGGFPVAAEIGWIDQDRFPDLAVVTEALDTSSRTSREAARGLHVALNDGSGSASRVVFSAVGGSPTALALADVDRDQRTDAVVTRAAADDVAVFLGDGSGQFVEGSRIAAGTLPSDAVLADLDGDGNVDLVVLNAGADSVRTYLGDGGGGLILFDEIPTGASPSALALTDLDGDAREDLLVANQGDGTVSVYLGGGDGSFTPLADYRVGTAPIEVQAGDLNGDGAADFAVLDAGEGRVRVFLGRGDGSFESGPQAACGAASAAMALADVDADRVPDLTVADTEAGVVRLFAVRSATAAEPAQGTPAPVAAPAAGGSPGGGGSGGGCFVRVAYR